ncbi:hypothetical protein AB1Y20_004518 [Prymnesium parvum]|uniref:Calcineurin-like phosphoesterase domain-containing protein n=1 Tax=Prymnesium parvum TaxID=97485 RepID=A0AB34IXR1_PRYPA
MPRPSTPTHSPHPAPPPSSSSLRIDQFKLTDDRKLSRTICRPPIVHVAHGFARHLSFLRAGRPLICLSDWQLEPATQRHFWAQAAAVLREQLGPAGLARALVLVAGDMASAGDALRGVASDAVPQLEWLQETVSCGDVLLVYGNHDRVGAEHLRMVCAASGLPCVLPQGRAVTVPLHGASGTAATPTPGFSGGIPRKKSQSLHMPMPSCQQPSLRLAHLGFQKRSEPRCTPTPSSRSGL